MMRPRTACVALAAAALVACGSDDAGSADDESDKRALALECLTEEKERQARLEGDDEIVLNENGPRIRFFLTAGEAEVAQFTGEAEGTEQIGSALVFVEPEVRADTEELLEDVESCLGEL
jgi:hypothetical protein